MTETQLQREIIQFLQCLGIVVWRTHSGTSMGGKMHHAPAGTPDIIGYLPGGRMLALEVKLPGGVVSDAQANWLKHAKSQGVLCAVVRSPKDAADIVRDARFDVPLQVRPA